MLSIDCSLYTSSCEKLGLKRHEQHHEAVSGRALSAMAYDQCKRIISPNAYVSSEMSVAVITPGTGTRQTPARIHQLLIPHNLVRYCLPAICEIMNRLAVLVQQLKAGDTRRTAALSSGHALVFLY